MADNNKILSIFKSMCTLGLKLRENTKASADYFRKALNVTLLYQKEKFSNDLHIPRVHIFWQTLPSSTREAVTE